MLSVLALGAHHELAASERAGSSAIDSLAPDLKLGGAPLSERLAALVGLHSEGMGVAVIVRDRELGLSVVAIHDLGS
jgi:hypothetical protein